MKKGKVLTIRQLLERFFISATVTIIVIILVGSFYFNHRSVQILRENNIQKTHETLTHLLVPALQITDSTEIRRLLKMTSNPNEIFAVIDGNNNILLSDYTQLNLIKAGLGNSIAAVDCQALHNEHRHINDRDYWIHCSPLFNNDIFNPNQRIGALVSFSHYSWLTLSPVMIYFLSTVIISLLITVALLRYLLSKRILMPLVELNQYIVNKAKMPLALEVSNSTINTAPHEIIAIKEAFEKVVLDLKDEYRQRIESEKKTVLLDLAAHVAHDIRSYLAVIEITLANISGFIPVSYFSIFNEAIQGMRYMANNLLEHYRDPQLQKNGMTESRSHDRNIARSLLLSSIINSIDSQKLHEWKHNPCNLTVTVDPSTKLKWIHAVPHDIKRILSNLLNNSYEALDKKREIQIKLFSNNAVIQLQINDTGRGIPHDKINDVLHGMSLKHSGTGLGLSSAKRYMEKLGGKLKLSSTLDQGTEITLSFPIAPKPTWFPESIQLPKNMPVLVLDDDSSIHNLWRDRLQSHGIHSQHFLNSEDILKWYEQHRDIRDKAIYLVDYQLHNDSCNGLDILQRINAKNRGYLITSHAEETTIQQRCEQLGVWLIAKSLVGEIILKIESSE